MPEAAARRSPAPPSCGGWFSPVGPTPWRGWWRDRRGRRRAGARARMRRPGAPAVPRPGRAPPGRCRSLGGLLGDRWVRLRLRLRLGVRLGIRLGVLRRVGLRRRALALRGLLRPLAVLAVVGDVEPAALENEARATRDLPRATLAADRTLGPRLVGHPLELLE